jgi:hypothetical protein
MISVVLTHGRTAEGSLTEEEEWQSHISHVKGAMNLLRLRGLVQFTHPRSEKIFRVFKAAIVRSNRVEIFCTQDLPSLANASFHPEFGNL